METVLLLAAFCRGIALKSISCNSAKAPYDANQKLLKGSTNQSNQLPYKKAIRCFLFNLHNLTYHNP